MRSSDPAPSRREILDGPPQLIVSGAELVIAAVPGVKRIACHVVQHPALARLHAGLVDLRAEHVVVVSHDDAVLGVDHFALVAFDVEDDTGGIFLLDDGAIALESVVRDREEGAAERVGVGDRRRCRVDRGLRGRGLLVRPEAPALSLPMPGRQVFRLGEPAEEIADIGIGLGICDESRVVDIPALLPPGVEHHLFPGVIGMQSGNDTLDGIVEEDRAYADLIVELGKREYR